jgi:hypothetical protein
MMRSVPLPTGPAPETLDCEALASRLADLEAALRRVRTEALLLSEHGRLGGELLYELDATRQGLGRAQALARALTQG